MNIVGLRCFEKHVIGGDESPLLIRWILIRTQACGIYVHKLCRSDHDRALHNHPWPFISIILSGGYWEVHDQTNDGTATRVWRGSGSILLRPAEWRHRLVLPSRPAWTLLVVGRRVQPWGFFLPGGWCWWRKHNEALGICEDGVVNTGGGD